MLVGLFLVVGAVVLLSGSDEGADEIAGVEDPASDEAGSARIDGRDGVPNGGSLLVDGSIVTIPAPDTTTVPGGSAPPPSTTAAIGAVPVGPTTIATTTTIPTGPVAPLTGLRVPIENSANVTRGLVTVKIDNKREARPQAGINQADIVFEVRVEGGLTRFIAMYHSTDAASIGPVRSARTTDVGLLIGFGSPVFGFSGANDGTLVDLEASALVLAPDGPGYRREPGRPVPHNLMTSTAGLYARSAGSSQPVRFFDFRDTGEVPPGLDTVGIRVAEGGSSEWVWSPLTGTWLRFQNGSPHLDADGRQVEVANVVVLSSNYGTSRHDAGSPELQLTGIGDALILSGGRVENATWRRQIPDQPPLLIGADGQVARLGRGRTWVVAAEGGRTTFLNPGRATALLR